LALNDDAEMFDLAPVSLWLEDYSALKALFERWRDEGVTDLRAHFAADPARVMQCSACIRVIKVNKKRSRCSGRATSIISSAISTRCSATIC
jgi:hypothetical protein